MAEERKDERGFVVIDRRGRSEESDARAPDAGAEPRREPPPRSGEAPRSGGAEGPDRDLPRIDFATFILSLSTSALHHLGLVPDPETQQPGPVNSPYIGVVSAIRCAIMALVIDDGRANEGYFRPIELKTRPGSMFDPTKPAPTGLASYPMYILIEGINEAIGAAVPERMPGGFDMCVSLIAWGTDESNTFWADSVNVVGGAPAAKM